MAGAKSAALLICAVALSACGNAAPAASAPSDSAPAAQAPAKAASSAANSGRAAAASGQASGTATTAKPASSGTFKLAYVAVSDSFLWERTAYQQGLFKKYGLNAAEPALVSGTPRLGQALVGGSFDAAGVGFGAAIDADVSGADLEAIASVSKYSSFALIVPQGSPVKEPKQLRGKTIALSQIGDTADQFLTTLLTRNGLNRSTDVTVTQAGSATNAALDVLGKKVDGASVGMADAFNAQARGATILATARQLNELEPQGSVLVRKSWAQGHKDQVLALMKSMMAGDAAYFAGEAQGVKVMQDSGWFKDVSPDILKAIWTYDVGSWSPAPAVNQDAAAEAIKAEAGRNPKVGQENPASLYDNSYVDELVNQGFLKTLPPRASASPAGSSPA